MVRARGTSAQRGLPVISVAAAVIQRADGSFLLAKRPTGKIFEGYWEFPGGKFEAGELPAQALRRELREELGIEVEQSYSWINRIHVYPHWTVRLNFQRVVRWRGEPIARECQEFVWQRPGALTVSPVLPANQPILKALQLPSIYGITNASMIGEAESLRRLEKALARGLRLVQVREKSMDAGQHARFARKVQSRCKEFGARVLINSDIVVARTVAADGVHLTSTQLRSVKERPPFEWCAASCHDERELSRAAHLGMDFVVLGPVLDTPTHPQASRLGWRRFSQLAGASGLPVYAIGGLGCGDLERSWSSGAHGIAMIRGAW